jgi:hypothetical protein
VLAGLLVLTFVFYLLYGPLEVALPVHIATDLYGSAALLGIYWAVFLASALATLGLALITTAILARARARAALRR